MSAPFANIPRHCRCGTARVDTTDRAELLAGALVVHGLHHCFTTAALAEQVSA